MTSLTHSRFIVDQRLPASEGEIVVAADLGVGDAPGRLRIDRRVDTLSARRRDRTRSATRADG